MAGRRGERGCERAHAWASLELDAELSQLERALLAAHLGRCASCAASVAEMRALTNALRGEPLERPSRALFVPAAVRRPRRAALAVRLAAAAALAVTAAGLGVFAGSFGRDGPTRPAPSQPEIALLPSADDLRDRRVLSPRSEAPADPLGPQPGRLETGV
jgi:predicted anti-sigma-YlaC factor YlaD